jgi:hypothetical protein
VPIELKIKWEGSAPGLAAKRLSLSAFGEPLTALLAGLRRIATNIVGDVFDDRQPRGRFANAARQLDIEISDLIKGSSGIDGVITVSTPVGGNLPLLDLAAIAGAQLLDALESESRGVARNASVRRYLQTLPRGITQQDYWLHQNGTVVKHVSFGEAVLPEVPTDIPFITQHSGNIIGVGFEPGRSEVRMKTETGSVILVANSDQVDKALLLRSSSEVRALAVVYSNAQRLLILQDAKVVTSPPSREESIYERWKVALKRLAQ